MAKTYNEIKAEIDAIKEASTSSKVTALNLGTQLQDALDFSTKELKVFAIGSSFTQDSLAYVPKLLKKISPNIEITLGGMYLSGSTLQQNYNNFVNDSAVYKYWKYNKTTGSYVIENEKTIKDGLDDDDWDIVLLGQGSSGMASYATYQPYLNNLIDAVIDYVGHSVKFGFIEYNTRVDSVDTSASAPTQEEKESYYADVKTRYTQSANCCKKILDETLVEFVIPVGTATMLARQNITFRNMGSWWMMTPDRSHLQEGIPCQLAGYVSAMALLKEYGLLYKCLGDDTMVTSEWTSSLNVPGPNGSVIPSTLEKNYLIQKYAVSAVKKPFVIPDEVEPITLDYSAATTNESTNACYLLYSGTTTSGKWIKTSRREFIYDLTGYEGRTISVTARQKTNASVVFCKFANGLPHETDWYDGKGADVLVTGNTSEEGQYLMSLSECFNTTTETESYVTGTVEKVVPSGAKYLLVTETNLTEEPVVVVY